MKIIKFGFSKFNSSKHINSTSTFTVTLMLIFYTEEIARKNTYKIRCISLYMYVKCVFKQNQLIHIKEVYILMHSTNDEMLTLL